VTADKTSAEFPSGMLDHQMDCIKHSLLPHVQAIQESENAQVALVYKMFKIQEEFLESILSDKWMSDKSTLALVGGIMINCDGEGTDRFLPLKFELRTLEGKTDVFEEAFGQRPENPHAPQTLLE